MPSEASPAFPYEPQLFSDDRTVSQRAKERLEILKQIKHLTRSATSRRRQAILDRLADGRKAREVPPFAVLPIGRVPAVPALALQEFLVRNADLARPDVQEVIKNFRLSVSDEPVMGGELVRLTLPPGANFRDVVAAIGKTVPIPPHYLHALEDGELPPPGSGGWIKGQGGPEPTASRPDWQPPGNPPIQVAVIDTGLGTPRTDKWLQGLTNPELDDLYPNPTYPDPKLPRLGLGAGHGNFVAGIVQQVEPSTDIRMYKGLDVDGLGEDTEVGKKIEQAAREGAKIINLSLGTRTVDDKPPPGIEAGIRRAIGINKNILIVCAAGNFGDTTKVWPAAFSLDFPKNVVSVAGLDAQGRKPKHEWSSHGDFVQFSTKGEGIASTYVKGIEDPIIDNPPDKFFDNAWAVWTGTSFAAPQIVGAVAKICLTDGVEPPAAIKILERGKKRIPGYGVAVSILPGTTVRFLPNAKVLLWALGVAVPWLRGLLPRPRRSHVT